MHTIKTTYADLPETIIIPPEFIHRKGEIIIIVEEEKSSDGKRLIDFFGALPDFPERSPQGEYESRDNL